MNEKMNYGLTRMSQMFSMIEDVVDVFAGPNEDKDATIRLMVGTISQETDLGMYKDRTPHKYGEGLTQVDAGLPYKDILERGGKWLDIAADKFGIDFSIIKHRDLAYSPLVGIILCRVKYKLVPSSIPKDYNGQWTYYKRWYNSFLGAATQDEFKESYTAGMKEYSEYLDSKIPLDEDIAYDLKEAKRIVSLNSDLEIKLATAKAEALQLKEELSKKDKAVDQLNKTVKQMREEKTTNSNKK